jgi:uncharacterized protein YyaL (SSP411 family)
MRPLLGSWPRPFCASSMTTKMAVFVLRQKMRSLLIYAPKPTLDETLPPGNATLALTLHRLGLLLGEQRYLDAAANTLRWARAVMEHLPTGHCGLLTALEDALLGAPGNCFARP